MPFSTAELADEQVEWRTREPLSRLSNDRIIKLIHWCQGDFDPTYGDMTGAEIKSGLWPAKTLEITGRPVEWWLVRFTQEAQRRGLLPQGVDGGMPDGWF